MKAVINVNRHVIAKNRLLTQRALAGEISREVAEADMAPTLSVKTYRSNQYTKHVLIKDGRGKVIAQIVYRPFKPLSCGATAWIEVMDARNVEVINDNSKSNKPQSQNLRSRRGTRPASRGRRACSL